MAESFAEVLLKSNHVINNSGFIRVMDQPGERELFRLSIITNT